MFLRFLAVLGLIGAVAGCDEPIKVERRDYVTTKDLMAMQDAGGLLVEVHGLPWAAALRAEVIGTLRMPAGRAAALRFRYIPPGQSVIGTGERLVLHFNPAKGPDKSADCWAKTDFITIPPTGRGFTVSATYCEGEDWLIHSYLMAEDISEDDWFGYATVMRKLLGTLFPEK